MIVVGEQHQLRRKIGGALTDAKDLIKGLIKIDVNGVITKVKEAVKNATGNITIGRDGTISIDMFKRKQ